MTGRNLVAADYSSRLSPYLTSGILSGRMVCNEARKLKGGKLESGRDTGIGMWVQEVSPNFVWWCQNIVVRRCIAGQD
jgi:deoxyribodipyrimidine photo-lyase